MSISDRMTAEALATAKAHVLDVAGLGGTVVLIKPLTKDEYGEILTETTLSLKSHPTRTSPFTKETFQKISWAEHVDIIFFVAKKQIDNLSLTLDQIKQYINCRFESRTYEIGYVERFSSFGTDCLYIVIGAKL